MVIDFNNGYEEFEVDVEFDYQPYEPATWSEWSGGYPGCEESVEVTEIRRRDNNSEIFLLDDTELDEFILERIFEEQQALFEERGE